LQVVSHYCNFLAINIRIWLLSNLGPFSNPRTPLDLLTMKT
jgi:hypothetical protein